MQALATDDESIVRRWLGVRVRRLREMRSLSQRQMAATLDMDQSTISAIESGTRGPSLETICMVYVNLCMWEDLFG